MIEPHKKYINVIFFL